MNVQRRLREIRLLLAISVGVFCACSCVLSMANSYYLARFNLDSYTRDLQGWEACRQARPSYYRANTEAVDSCLKGLDAARDNFWVRLSSGQRAGLFILAGLGGTVGGYVTTWAVASLGGLAIGKLFRWLAFAVRRPASRHVEAQAPAAEDQGPTVEPSKKTTGGFMRFAGRANSPDLSAAECDGSKVCGSGSPAR